jgi:hypothetical protein
LWVQLNQSNRAGIDYGHGSPSGLHPKVRDEVAVSGHIGSSFIVHSVNTENQTVDLRQVGPSNAVNIVGIQWDDLKLLRRGPQLA